MLSVSEVMKHYTLDRTGIMFVVDVIGEALTYAVTPSDNNKDMWQLEKSNNAAVITQTSNEGDQIHDSLDNAPILI